MTKPDAPPKIGTFGSNAARAKGRALRSLYAAHRGKVSDKWSSYLDVYDRIFSEIRNSPIRLLEIGVQNGGSLEIWRKYFVRSKLILGCDINMVCAKLHFDDEGIDLVIGNANCESTKREIIEKSDNFEIIIDDGSHKSSDIIRDFANYFSIVADGGLYVIEDMHCSYWNLYEGGLYDPYSSMSFFKRLLDVINQEHWGLDLFRADALAAFAKRHEITFDEASLASIHSIEFFNSLCVVTKRLPKENGLGRRHVAGRVALVEEGLLSQKGAMIEVADEIGKPWSLQSTTMEEEIGINRELVSLYRTRIEAFAREIAKAREQIRSAEDKVALAKAQTVAKDEEIQILRRERDAMTSAFEAELNKRALVVQQLKNSTSWRITGPLRALSANARWLLQRARRMIQHWSKSH